ncbi:DUF6984 family protein [Cupriavidus sp. 30B13]|uniref:DUF6984 family protein n=1 Tax=Cupriavidus sp. 30B13 TaxID=3384241 RepID=UPI003B98290E
MTMRQLTHEEQMLIMEFARKLEEGARQRLLEDLRSAATTSVAPDGSRVVFEISGYERPPYRGQHPIGVEGRMLDGDGVDLSVLLYADENDHLLELEFIRWDASDLVGPRWDTLTLW